MPSIGDEYAPSAETSPYLNQSPAPVSVLGSQHVASDLVPYYQ